MGDCAPDLLVQQTTVDYTDELYETGGFESADQALTAFLDEHIPYMRRTGFEHESATATAARLIKREHGVGLAMANVRRFNGWLVTDFFVCNRHLIAEKAAAR
jgi:hypothetical protein